MESTATFDSDIVMEFYTQMITDKQHRYKSWEHCYTAFQNVNDTELLTLHLAFYLASWGMYRGSSGLLQKDYTIHYKTVEILKSPQYSQLNAAKHEITRDNIQLITELRNELKAHYASIEYDNNKKDKPKISPTDTLLSKIMLGTLGCVPAFDRYFLDGVKEKKLMGRSFNEKLLHNLFNFIENAQNRIHIKNVKTKIAAQGITYPTMKIIDMYFWKVGFDKDQKTNK